MYVDQIMLEYRDMGAHRGHPKMSRGWSYTQKEGPSRMMAIGIVLRSTHGQPVPKDAPWMLVVQRCEA